MKVKEVEEMKTPMLANRSGMEEGKRFSTWKEKP